MRDGGRREEGGRERGSEGVRDSLLLLRRTITYVLGRNTHTHLRNTILPSVF